MFNSAVSLSIDAVIYPNTWLVSSCPFLLPFHKTKCSAHRLISRDPKFYPDPDVFDPTRYLRDPPALDPYLYIFGFGRRICVGQHYADATVFIAIASLLAAFDITPGEGAKFVVPEGHGA